MKRKNFAAALIVALCMVTVVGFVPVLSAPAQAYTGYYMYVGSTQFTSDVSVKHKNFRFDAATDTLYLHGNISGTYNNNVMSAIQCNGYTGDRLKIIVDGNSTVDAHSTVKGGIFSNCKTYIYVKKGCTLTIKSGYGVSVRDNLYLTGKGTINVYVRGNRIGGISSHGGVYYYNSKYNFTRAHVTINDLHMLKVTSLAMYGIYAECGNVSITNSTVYATGYAGGIASYYGNIKITESTNGKFVYARATKGIAVAAVSKGYSKHNANIAEAASSARLYLGKSTGISKPSGSRIKAIKAKKIYTNPGKTDTYLLINGYSIKKGTSILKTVLIK
jgi:hypothetical protein